MKIVVLAITMLAVQLNAQITRTDVMGFEMGATWFELRTKMIDQQNRYFAIYPKDNHDVVVMKSDFNHEVETVDKTGAGEITITMGAGQGFLHKFYFEKRRPVEVFVPFENDRNWTFDEMLPDIIRMYGKPDVLRQENRPRVSHTAEWRMPDGVLIRLIEKHDSTMLSVLSADKQR